MSGLPPDVLRYFAAEKQESLLFLGVGLLSVATAGVLWRTPFRGAAWPLIALGLVELVVGSTIVLRTDRQVAELGRRVVEDVVAARTEETARMTRVMASFRIYKVVELALLTAGLALWMVFPRTAGAHWAGVGCAVEASLLLVLDLVAARRGAAYLETIRRMG
jgi:hypothetical protein